MTDTSGGFRAARGCSPVPPDAEPAAAIIRRLRDGSGEEVLDMTITTVGQWIQEQRIERGMEQQELAAQSGISPQYLSDIERNRRQLTESVARRIAEVFGWDADILIVRSGHIPAGLMDSVPMTTSAEVVSLLRTRAQQSEGTPT